MFSLKDLNFVCIKFRGPKQYGQYYIICRRHFNGKQNFPDIKTEKKLKYYEDTLPEAADRNHGFNIECYRRFTVLPKSHKENYKDQQEKFHLKKVFLKKLHLKKKVLLYRQRKLRKFKKLF